MMAILMVDSLDLKNSHVDWEKVWPKKAEGAVAPNFLAALLANGKAGVNVLLPEGAFTIAPMKVEDGVVRKWEVEVWLPKEEA